MPVSTLSIDDVIRRIGEIGIIPVVRASSVDEANRAVEAICAGGIPAVEITMTVPNAVSVIRELVQHRENDVLIGAGTVTNAAQAESCILAGAQFLVSPGLSTAVLAEAKNHSILAIPGALTPDRINDRSGARCELAQNISVRKRGRSEIPEIAKGPIPECHADSYGRCECRQCGGFHSCRSVCIGSRRRLGRCEGIAGRESGEDHKCSAGVGECRCSSQSCAARQEAILSSATFCAIV